MKNALKLQKLNTNVAKNVIMFLGDGEAGNGVWGQRSLELGEARLGMGKLGLGKLGAVKLGALPLGPLEPKAMGGWKV